MRFSTLIFRNVFRRLIRSSLTMTGMAVAVAAVVAGVGLADGLRKSVLEIYESRNVSLVVAREDTASIIGTVMPQEFGEAIKKVPGVEKTCLGLLNVAPIEDLGSENVTIQGWGLGAYMYDEIKPNIVSGKVLDESSKGKHEVMVGAKLASLRNLKVGSTFSINSDQKFEVVGVFKSDQDMENSMIVALLQDVQQILGQKDAITGCTVIVDKAHDNEAGVAEIAAIIDGPLALQYGLKGKIHAKPPKEFVAQNKQFKLVTGMAWAFSFVALIIGGIGVLNTMIMSVFERTREIGILRAIGWRPSRIVKMILMESVLLSFGGGILGTIGGIGMILVASRFASVSGIVHASISTDIVVKGFVVAMVVGLFGAAWPAYRGSRLLPTEALRHE